jgi:uncharacterized protein YuzE
MPKRNRPTLEYDPEVDAAYISFGTGKPSVTSVVADEVFLDFSMEGNVPTGLEILNFSKVRGVKKLIEVLKNVRLDQKPKNPNRPRVRKGSKGTGSTTMPNSTSDGKGDGKAT